MVGRADPVRVRAWATTVARPGTAAGTQLTDKGIARFAEIVAAVREAVGWEIPLASTTLARTHGQRRIRLGQALEPYGLAWMEDIHALVGRRGQPAGDAGHQCAHAERRGHLSAGTAGAR